MIALTRTPLPQILANRGTQWLDNFISSNKKRPPSSQYGHESIRRDLNSMSHHKCFYCETKLKGIPKEVDHQIEVSVEKNGAFEWQNLYLSCTSCNDKLDHITIPIGDALDPCRNDDQTIQDNLTFVDHSITAVAGSPIGLKTIQKYRLDSDVLDNRRMHALQSFHKVLIAIQKKIIEEGSRPLSVQERQLITHFGQRDQPFSLMFKIILAQNGF